MSRLPPTATLLGVNRPEFALFSRSGEPLCIVGGRSYYSQSWPEGEDIASGISRKTALEELARQGVDAAKAPFMVGVVHAALEPDQSKAATDLRNLLAADVDYWACGHLHERRAFPSEASPRVVYPGCVQGRTIEEAGERGCFLVELQEGGWDGGPSSPPPLARIEFIPTSSVVLQRLSVDVSACRTLADIRRLVQVELFHENGKAHCDEMVTRIILAGETPLHRFLIDRNVLTDLRQQINNAFPTFFCDALIDATRDPGGVGPGEGEGPFLEVVSSMAEEQRLREDVLINFVQSEFVKRGIVVPSTLTELVGEFEEEAERTVFDLLRGDAR